MSVRLTVPLNPLIAVTVIVDVAEAPALAVAEVAVTVKSVKLNVALAECVMPVDFVATIVTVNVPADAEEQLRIAVPEFVIVLGVMTPQVKPTGTMSVRVMVPEKPLSATAVMVEVAEAVASTAAGELAAIVKSVTLNTAVAECDRVPLVPVMVRANVPAVTEVHDTVAVPEPTMLLGVIAPQVRPAGGVSVRFTVPANPLRAVTVIVELAATPAGGSPAGDVAAIVKSTKLNVAVVE